MKKFTIISVAFLAVIFTSCKEETPEPKIKTMTTQSTNPSDTVGECKIVVKITNKLDTTRTFRMYSFNQIKSLGEKELKVGESHVFTYESCQEKDNYSGSPVIITFSGNENSVKRQFPLPDVTWGNYYEYEIKELYDCPGCLDN